MDFNRVNTIIRTWKSDFDFKTFIVAGFSLVASVFFAAYNGFLCVMHYSLWNGSICLYYLLLSLIRATIIYSQHRAFRAGNANGEQITNKVFRITSAALIALNLTLVVPISLMVELKKPVVMGLIPAIAMAAYTFYRLPLAIFNFSRSRQSENLLTRELRTVNLMDALLAIVTTQNALVSVKDNVASGRILALTAISSAALLIAIIALSLRNRTMGMRGLRKA